MAAVSEVSFSRHRVGIETIEISSSPHGQSPMPILLLSQRARSHRQQPHQLTANRPHRCLATCHQFRSHSGRFSLQLRRSFWSWSSLRVTKPLAAGTLANGPPTRFTTFCLVCALSHFANEAGSRAMSFRLRSSGGTTFCVSDVDGPVAMG